MPALAETMRRTAPARNGALITRPPHVSLFAVALGRRIGCAGRTAQRRIEVARDLLRDVAKLVIGAPEHGDAAVALVSSVTAAATLGKPSPWTADLAVTISGHDGREDGPLAMVCAAPFDVVAVKTWLRTAKAEQLARAEGIASAEAWVASQGRDG